MANLKGVDHSLKVLACQLTVPQTRCVEDRDTHLAISARQVSDQLTDGPARLVVLPELSSIEYSRDSFNQLAALAEPLDGPSFEVWREVAMRFDCYVLYGFPRALTRSGKTGYSICAAIVSPQGELTGSYDKLHFAQFGDSMEKEYFSFRGENLLVVDVDGFRLAPIICYDIRVPELCRVLAIEHGVDAILHIGAYARDPSFYSWHHFAVTRAIENQIYFLSVNRAGSHFGHSIFCTPWVDGETPAQVFSQFGEEFRYLQLRREEIDCARRDYTFLQDRLADYSSLQVNG